MLASLGATAAGIGTSERR